MTVLKAIKMRGTPYMECSIHGLLPADAKECHHCEWKPVCPTCGNQVDTPAMVSALTGAGVPYKDPHEACRKQLNSFWIEPNEQRA